MKLSLPGKSKKFVLFEIGIAIVLFILFIGILNSIAYTQRTLIITAEDVYRLNETVRIGFVNTTTDAWTIQEYPIQSIAVLTGGKLYIALPPPPSGYNAYTSIRVFLNRTLGALVERGLSYVEVYFVSDARHNKTLVMPFIGIGAASVVASSFNHEGFSVHPIAQARIENLTATTFFNATIDPGLFALKASSWGPSQEAVLFIGHHAGNAWTGSYIVLDFELYAISDKPVLKALMEPIYSFFAAMYTVLLAAIRRVKKYVVTAFGGFATSFTLTGLIGDPVVALILTMIFITIVFLVIKPHRRLL